MLRIRITGPSPSDIRRRIEEAAQRAIGTRLAELERRARMMRCPHHHRPPSTWRSGTEFRFNACCPVFAGMVKRALGL